MDYPDGVVFNLYLTRQCNLTCAHCFTFSGPGQMAAYMSDEVLQAVARQAEILHDGHILQTRLNLVGGEPTLNVAEFERVCATLRTLQREREPFADIDMSTNGWWLKRPDAAKRILEAYGAVFNDYEQTHIRVSDDPYHRRSPGAFFQESKELDWALHGLWEMGDSPWWESRWLCTGCDSYRAGPTCPDCGDDEIVDDGNLSEDCPPNPFEDERYRDWIYVQHNDHAPVKSGRGYRLKEAHNYNEGGAHGYCRKGVFSYTPTGELSDICCLGSNFPVGTVYDDPFKLLKIIERFHKVTSHKSCTTCPELMQDWIKLNLKKGTKNG